MYHVNGPSSSTATINITNASHHAYHGDREVTITCGIPGETAPDGGSLTDLQADLRHILSAHRRWRF